MVGKFKESELKRIVEALTVKKEVRKKEDLGIQDQYSPSPSQSIEV